MRCVLGRRILVHCVLGRRGLGWLLGLLATAVAAPFPVAAQPPLSLVRDGTGLVLHGLPDVLAQPEIATPLTSGLTTSFVFQATGRDARGARATAAGLVEVRYELWDEIFLVTRTGEDGKRERLKLASRSELGEWWQHAELMLGQLAGLAASDPWQVRLELSVVPFSSAEQRDTQRWVSRSLDAARKEKPAGEGAAPASPELAVSDVLNLLLSTSIERSSLSSFEWRLTLPPAGRS